MVRERTEQRIVSDCIRIARALNATRAALVGIVPIKIVVGTDLAAGVVDAAAELSCRVAQEQVARHCRVGGRVGLDSAAVLGRVVHECVVRDRRRSGRNFDAAAEGGAMISRERTVRHGQDIAAGNADVRISADGALRNGQRALIDDTGRSAGDGQIGDDCRGRDADCQYRPSVTAADSEAAGAGSVDRNGFRYRQRSVEDNRRAGGQRKNNRVAIVCVRQSIAQRIGPAVGVTRDRHIRGPCEFCAQQEAQ